MEWVKCSHYFDLIKMCYSELPRICNDTKVLFTSHRQEWHINIHVYITS